MSHLRERRPCLKKKRLSFWKSWALSRVERTPPGRLSCSSFQRTKGRWWKQEPLAICLMFKQHSASSRLFLYDASSFFNLIVIRLVSEFYCAIPPWLFPLKSLFLLCKKRKKKKTYFSLCTYYFVWVTCTEIKWEKGSCMFCHHSCCVLHFINLNWKGFYFFLIPTTPSPSSLTCDVGGACRLLLPFLFNFTPAVMSRRTAKKTIDKMRTSSGLGAASAECGWTLSDSPVYRLKQI